MVVSQLNSRKGKSDENFRSCIALLLENANRKSKDVFPLAGSTTYPLNFDEIINKGLKREMRM